jgi:nucleoside-diphosphate-sugar epimerase
MGDLAAELIRQINPAATIVVDEARTRPPMSEVERLLGSNEKIQALTTWRPRHDLQDGLGRTIAWFRERENFGRYKADIYNL